MSDMLKIEQVKEGDIPVLHFDGTLDGQTEKLAIEAAQAVFDSGSKKLVINLSNVEMVTSAGLRALHSIYKMFTPMETIQAWQAEHDDEPFKSSSFVLAEPSSQVHYVLSIAGFLQSIRIFPSMQEALDFVK